MGRCSNCGAENTDEAIFCQKCGGKMTPKDICPRCGCVTVPDQLFCSHCGTRLQGNETEPKPEAATSVKAAEKEPETVAAGEAGNALQPFSSPQNKNAGNHQKKSSSPYRAILIVVLVVVLGVATAALCWYFFAGNGGRKSAAQTAQVQANISNSGFVTKVGNTVYVKYYQTGIFVCEDGRLGRQIAEGWYLDLAAVGQSLFCIEITNDQCVVEKIDPDTGSVTVMFEKPKMLNGLAVIDGRYYFAVENDRLYCVDEDGTVTDTGYRHVKQVTEEGVFTTAMDDTGLMFDSFDGKQHIEYDELDNYIVDVFFEKEGTAVIRYYNTDDMIGQIAILDVAESTLTNVFYESEWLMEQDEYLNVISSRANFYKDTLIIGVTSLPMTTGPVEGFTNNYYYLDENSQELIPIHECVSDVAPMAAVIDDELYTFDLLQGEYELTVLPLAESGE